MCLVGVILRLYIDLCIAIISRDGQIASMTITKFIITALLLSCLIGCKTHSDLFLQHAQQYLDSPSEKNANEVVDYLYKIKKYQLNLLKSGLDQKADLVQIKMVTEKHYTALHDFSERTELYPKAAQYLLTHYEGTDPRIFLSIGKYFLGTEQYPLAYEYFAKSTLQNSSPTSINLMSGYYARKILKHFGCKYGFEVWAGHAVDKHFTVIFQAPYPMEDVVLTSEKISSGRRNLKSNQQLPELSQYCIANMAAG